MTRRESIEALRGASFLVWSDSALDLSVSAAASDGFPDFAALALGAPVGAIVYAAERWGYVRAYRVTTTGLLPATRDGTSVALESALVAASREAYKTARSVKR